MAHIIGKNSAHNPQKGCT